MVFEADFEGRCPYLGLEDDPETWFAFSSDANYCHRVSPSEGIARNYQIEACLLENFVTCPVFRAAADWHGRLPSGIRRKTERRRRRRTSKPNSGARAAEAAASTPQPRAPLAGRPSSAPSPSSLLIIGAAAIAVITLVAFSAFLAFSVIRGNARITGSPTPLPEWIAALTTSPGAQPTATSALAPPALTPASGVASLPTFTPFQGMPSSEETLTPTEMSEPTQPPSATSTQAAPSEPVSGMTYVVRRGDNLYRIALRYGISVDAILRANNLSNPNLLHAGQSLILPGVEPSPEEDEAPPSEEGEEPSTGQPATTTHIVQRGENLFRIALRYGTTIDVLAAYNGLTDPRRIETGQTLIVPLTDEAAQTAPESSAAGETLAPEGPIVVSPEGITVQIGEPIYGGDGRVAEIAITVSNQSLTPAVAGGRYYIATNPDGNRRWITLLRAAHQDVPVPILAEPTPLWHAIVTLTDGVTFDAYAGCIYEEYIFAEGDEPNAPGGSFHWTATLEDGWFDCGNAYQVKPEDLTPGQSATVPLTVYVMHPREAGIPSCRIRRIDLELWRSDGASLGIVAARDYD